MNRVIVYTDGSCYPNPGPGGWAAILTMGSRRKQLSGYLPKSTNNQAELVAVLEGIKALQCACEVVVVTDSRLVIGWLSSGWKRKNHQCAVICAAIDQEVLLKGHSVSFKHVKGHSGVLLNEAADVLAGKARREGSNRAGLEGGRV